MAAQKLSARRLETKLRELSGHIAAVARALGVTGQTGEKGSGREIGRPKGFSPRPDMAGQCAPEVGSSEFG
jgi:hypothetical protein